MWYEIGLCSGWVLLLLNCTVLLNYFILRLFLIKLDFEHHPKNWIEEWNDLLITLCLSLLFYSTGTWIGSPFLFMSLPANILFSVLGKYSPTSLASYATWTKRDYILYSAGGLCVYVVLFYHLYLSHQFHMLTETMSLLLCIHLIYLVGYLRSQNTFHPHHYFIAFCLLFFIRFPDAISQFCGGICFGIFINGTGTYKVGNPLN